MPTTFTTDLPTASIDSLDNGIEDEVTVHWPDVINYGSYEVEYRESSASTWSAGATVGQAVTSATVGSLEDGEEYDFRIRTTTEHVTTDWSAVATITTAFPTPTTPSASNPTKTSIDISFEDHADNEDGFRVERARKYDYGWGPFQVAADLGSNAGTGTVTYTDDSVSPGNSYKYRIEAYTEDTSNTSAETSAVTTPSSGRPRTDTGAKGWQVEIDHPSGQVLEPRLLDNPRFTPALMDYPKIEIPVPRNEKWQASAFEDTTVRVWKDGRILPIEQLVTVRMETDQTVLVAHGGVELDSRVTEEFDDEAAHLAAEQLIKNQTTYTANVDDPASTTEPNTLMQSGDSSSELESKLLNAIEPTDPYYLTSDGRLEFYQTCYFVEAENRDRDYNGAGVWANSAWSAGGGMRLVNSGEAIEFDFTLPYTIPASDLGVKVRDESADVNGINWELDGYQLTTIPESAGQINLDWTEIAAESSYNGNGWTGPDLSAGTHTLRCEVDGEPGNYDIDGVALYDRGTRFGGFTYNWDNNNGGNSGYLDGPEKHPDALEIVFEDVSTAKNVTGGRIEVTMDDTSGKQALALSNDQGNNYQSGSNTSAFETDFASAGGSIRWKLTLSRYGSQTGATPKQGIHSQSLDLFDLFADLEDTPVLDEQKYDALLIDVLSDIADYGNFIWEIQRDRSGWRIEWTQLGQRTASSDPGIVDFRVEKSTAQSYDKAVIKGGARPVRGDGFTANHGSYKSLSEAHLVPGTERVYDPSNGTVFDYGVDYTLNRATGEIKTLSAGSMTDGASYEIDYQFKAQGSYTAPISGSDPDETVQDIPSIVSNRGCDQAALYLIQRVQDPVWNATVTVPRDEAGRSLLDDLLIEDLPTQGTRMEIQEIEQTPEKVVLQMGSRQSVSDVVSDISHRIGDVAERV